MSTVYKKIERIRKGDLYNRMIELMKEAGWEDISSLPSKDGNVMFSRGEDGLQEIYLQMHESYNRTANYRFSTTAYRYFSMRPLSGYTPGDSGSVGAPIPSNQSWVLPVVCTKEGLANYELNLYYLVDKNRVAFITEDVLTGQILFTYAGKPSPSYNKAYANQNIIIVNYNNRERGNAIMLGLADTRIKTDVVLNLMLLDTGNAFNAKRDVVLTDIGLMHEDTGFIGYLDGMYAVDGSFSSASYLGKKYIIANNKKYRLFKGDSKAITGSDWFNLLNKLPLIAIEVEGENEL